MQHANRSMAPALAVALTSTVAGLLPAQAPTPVDAPIEATRWIDFDREIRPILSDTCFKCHGPDAGNRKADLRLDLRKNAFANREQSPPAIVAGDPSGSELVRRILHEDAGERMPPRSSKKQLDAREKQLLVAWIDQGAKWAEHWAFVKPTIPKLPTVKLAAWPKNPIDRLTLARLESEDLRPSPAADRRTLLRRVFLDLTGLPPPADALAEFLQSDTPGSYEKVVDRLLESSDYGEHMARFWLDAARYGDTHGLHLDSYREMWHYRDWVVRAFQNNLPFDRFTVEQIAGDLLPNPTLDQKIASGFNRCHITTAEGGSIKEEVYVRNVIDRVSTTGTVFLGLTLGCAVCHDHKFDPISQREFYQLFAFFNNMDGDPMDGNKKAHAPVIRIPSAEQKTKLATLDQAHAALQKKIRAILAETQYTEPEPTPSTATSPRRTIVWIDDDLPAGATAAGNGFEWTEQPEFVHHGRRAMKRTSRGSQQHYFKTADRKLRVGAGDILFAWVFLDPKDPPAEIMLQWNDDGDAGWNHRAYWGQNKINSGKNNTAGRRRMGKLPAVGKWTKLAVPAARVGLRPGMAVHGVAFTQFDGTSYWDTVGIETATSQEPEDFVWIDDAGPQGSKLAGNGKTWQWIAPEADATPQPVAGDRVLRRQGAGLNQDYLTDTPIPLRLQAGDRLFAHVWLDPKDPPTSVQLQFFMKNWNHRARWGAPAHGSGTPNGGDYVAGELPETGKWIRLEVPIAKVGLAPGKRVTGWAFTQVDGTVYWDKAGVHTWGPPNDAHLHSLRAWEQVAKDDGSVPAPIRKALAVAQSERTPKQAKSIRNHYLQHVFAGTRSVFVPLKKQLVENRKQKTAVERAIPTTLVMKERAKSKDAFLLRRGQYDQKGDKVLRATPAALPPMPEDLPRNRLGLAKWLVDPAHPLTARVTVNRFWQQVFGTGLVKTSEDFGNQGERASHPELLDWLATRFIADGWDVKKFMKLLVMSATYRQSSRITKAALVRDPDNRLLARGPRFRLDAETLRDQAFAISGLLKRQVGGPAVKPPQPAGLWKAVGYSSSNTANFRADKGPDKVHRRSIYTFWKRTAPPPQMTTFDAPSREECRVRRERTNTPLQALLLMNDPQYVESARRFAERILTEGGADDRARAKWALQLATCNSPRDGDVKDVLDLVRRERIEFGKTPKLAAALIATGETKPDPKLAAAELAAWTMVANLILNLDEVVTKG